MARRYVVPVSSIRVTSGAVDDSQAILVGGDTAFRDRSDATYAELQQSPTSSFVGWAEGFFEATELPQMSESARVLFRARLASIDGAGAPIQAIRFEASSIAQAYSDETAAVWPATPAWVDLPLILEPGVTVDVLRSYAAEGRLSAEIRPWGPAGWYYVYEFDLVFQTRGGLHPCVQFPRDDGRATSSAKRHYPPSPSWQTGTRWRGGYY